jgi:hypothetical protein
MWRRYASYQPGEKDQEGMRLTGPAGETLSDG